MISVEWLTSARDRLEGSVAIVLAAAIEDSSIEKPAVVILTGGNIQPELFSAIIDEGQMINV
jgi:threonine dehydratase